MSYSETPVRRVPMWLWCDCADGMSEHDLIAGVRTDRPREGELLSIVMRCRDCNEERVLD